LVGPGERSDISDPRDQFERSHGSSEKRLDPIGRSGPFESLHGISSPSSSERYRRSGAIPPVSLQLLEDLTETVLASWSRPVPESGPTPSVAAVPAPPPLLEQPPITDTPSVPDADTLATLVNQVLFDEARRHGVDLS
jgi:hypothetical protein